MPRLVLDPAVRLEAEERAMQAAYEANDTTDIGYHAEELVMAAVRAVLDVIEERLA